MAGRAGPCPACSQIVRAPTAGRRAAVRARRPANRPSSRRGGGHGARPSRFPRSGPAPGLPFPGVAAGRGRDGPARPLPRPESPGDRRHGRRLPGGRPPPPAPGGPESHAAVAGGQRRVPPAISARGPAGRRHRPRAHRHRLSGGRGPRRPVPGHAAAPWPDPRRPAGAGRGPAAAARSAAHRPGDRGGSGRGPRPGSGPPRRQAGQRVAGGGAGPRPHCRFRPGPRVRAGRPVHSGGGRDRHARLHGPRAGQRRGGGRPVRPVQPGGRAVSGRHGRVAVRRQGHAVRPALRWRRGRQRRRTGSSPPCRGCSPAW